MPKIFEYFGFVLLFSTSCQGFELVTSAPTSPVSFKLNFKKYQL